MNKLNVFCSILVVATMFVACGGNSKAIRRTDTTSSGVARIVVDECLAPIIQQQVDVFQNTYEDATIIPVYTSDKEAYKLFMEDSIRLIIGTRDITEAEKKIIKDRKQLPRSQKLAIDGVALITNVNNPDSLITLRDIKRIMTGEITSWKDLNPDSKLNEIAVTFDTPNSSTARYINDSICGGATFGSNVKAIGNDADIAHDIQSATPNQKVIKFVKENPNALGIIGVSWVSNPADTLSLSFSRHVNIMSVSREDVATLDNSYKPYPAMLALGWYPLSRNVYIIITDVRGGLPAGFVSFAAGEIGQRMINKSGLFPATVPTRIVNVRPTL